MTLRRGCNVSDFCDMYIQFSFDLLSFYCAFHFGLLLLLLRFR
jgi:hypothetical protein